MKSLLRRQVVGRARDRAAKRAWLVQAEANSDAPLRMAVAADGNVGGEKGFHAKLPADHPAYKAVVAEPVMRAVDGLPLAYRGCVGEFGYVEVFLCWRRGMTPERIRAIAEANGGVLPPP